MIVASHSALVTPSISQIAVYCPDSVIANDHIPDVFVMVETTPP